MNNFRIETLPTSGYCAYSVSHAAEPLTQLLPLSLFVPVVSRGQLGRTLSWRLLLGVVTGRKRQPVSFSVRYTHRLTVGRPPLFLPC